MTTHDEQTLWLTIRGASRRLGAGWMGWMVLASVGALLVGDAFGPTGPVLAVAAGGWLLARRLPAPPEVLRRYHLDDAEVIVAGPGRRVRRVAWGNVTAVTQGRHTLRLRGPGVAAELPLSAVVDADACVPVLARVVPALAEAIWERLDEGEVPLNPDLDPPTHALAWWAWVPAAAAGLVAYGATGVAFVVALVVAERAVALWRARWHAVTLHPSGVALHRGFVPWPRAEVAPAMGGLQISDGEKLVGMVAGGLPNFWPAAAVVQLRVELGPVCPTQVHFRVRVANGGVAVVGEVEAVS
jgi:hypothetical protein